ncbi:MAG: hypothetical protein E6G71_09030 [Alphaproteobacteria bacterium]|nr:MAG: hypothetical protein E6G71_09030 [Alphaproteobacteria bacterium]
MRGIQYAAASRFHYAFSGILDRPVKPGDDDYGCGASAKAVAQRVSPVLRLAWRYTRRRATGSRP